MIGLHEDALIQGAFRVYLLPLIALFVGALIGKAFAGLTNWHAADFGSALGGILGLVLCLAGLKVSRFFDRPGFQPVILRKIN